MVRYINTIVTPFTGVWIEILPIVVFPYRKEVTPFTGVWIEISRILVLEKVLLKSHPSRVCGLKYTVREIVKDNAQSHPSRVCGLK